MTRWTPGGGRGLGRWRGLLAVLVCITPPIASGDGSQAAQGIADARAAGITVDPAAEALMKAAPLGSCLNDPTQDKCPAVKAIVKSESARSADGSLGYAPATARVGTSSQGDHEVQLRSP